MPDETMTREEAVQKIADLTKARAELGADLAKNTEAIGDLTKAVRTLQEHSAMAQRSQEVTSSDYGIRKFINADAKSKADAVRWVGKQDERTGEWQSGLLDAGEVHGEWHAKLLNVVHKRNWVRYFRRRDDSPAMDKELEFHMSMAPAAIRKIFADAAGFGAEWVEDRYLPLLEADLRMTRRTEALFQTMEMPAKTVIVPRRTTGLRPYIKGEVTTDDPGQYIKSSLGTANLTLTAKGFAVLYQSDEDASEDSIIMLEPLVRSELAAAILDGSNDAIINGDATGTHQDAIATWDPRSRWGANGLGGSSDHRRAWTGLRARAYDVSNTTDQSAAQTYAGMLTAQGKLASPHGVEGDLVMLVSPEYFVEKVLGFEQVATLDKYGAQASILGGEVARVGMARVIIDEFLTSDLATSGLYTGSGATTGFLLLNRQRFKMGVRKGAMVEIDKDITRGVINNVVTARKLFFTTDSPTTKNVHWSFNL